jgi:hypothetical protein
MVPPLHAIHAGAIRQEGLESSGLSEREPGVLIWRWPQLGPLLLTVAHPTIKFKICYETNYELCIDQNL